MDCRTNTKARHRGNPLFTSPILILSLGIGVSSRVSRCLRPAPQIQFIEDMPDMMFDRFGTNHQAAGDFPIGQTICEQVEDLCLALGERFSLLSSYTSCRP